MVRKLPKHPPRTTEGNGYILILIRQRWPERRSYVSNNEKEQFLNSTYKLQHAVFWRIGYGFFRGTY